MHRHINNLLAAAIMILAGVNSLAGEIHVKANSDCVRVDNGRIVLRVNKNKNSSAELLYMDGKKTVRATLLVPFAYEKKLTVLKSFRIKKADKNTVKIEAVYSLPENSMVPVNYTVTADSSFAGISCTKTRIRLILEIKSEALVVPDQIGEDIVLYPPSGPGKYTLPADARYALNMLDHGNAILTVIWSSGQTILKEGRLAAGKTAPSGFEFMNIELPANEKLWVGTSVSPGIWQKVTEKLNDMEFTALAWKPPFPAQWFIALKKNKGFISLENGQNDIWPLPERRNGKKPRIRIGIIISNPVTWKGWSSSFGGFIYPGFIRNGKAFLRYPKFTVPVSYDASFPPLIYPLENSNVSKITLPGSAAKKLLGKKIYNRLHCVKDSKAGYPATCGITAKIEKIFYRDETVKERENIAGMLEKMNMFVVTVRERIDKYLTWHERMEKYFAAARKTSPELSGVINDFDHDLAGLKKLYSEKKDAMKTPRYSAELSRKILGLIGSGLDEEQQEEECKNLGREIRILGGSQDRTLGKMRILVKAVRQKATLMLMKSRNPEEIGLLMHIRKETARILHTRFGMEGK